MSKASDVVLAAESQIGSPYVYGTWGQLCTPALRKRYAKYSPSQAEITYKRCPVLSGKQSNCTGCKYDGRLAFDCRGFTHWALKQVGIDITGGYVGRQWSDPNWAEKGDIADMPDLVCCVFIRKSDGNWSHTGLHIGGGQIIHCSGEVKRDHLGGDRDWTHYGIPKGLYTAEEIERARKDKPIMRTLRRGMQGEDVRALQTALNAQGYDCGTADGVYGKATEKAVREFQAANNIAVDGIAGPVTLARLGLKDYPSDEPDAPTGDPEKPETGSRWVSVDRDALREWRDQMAEIIDEIDRLLV